jgi:hypothetical protein
MSAEAAKAAKAMAGEAKQTQYCSPHLHRQSALTGSALTGSRQRMDRQRMDKIGIASQFG